MMSGTVIGGWRKTAPFNPAVRARAVDRGARLKGNGVPRSFGNSALLLTP
jgi:hypothetical protein